MLETYKDLKVSLDHLKSLRDGAHATKIFWPWVKNGYEQIRPLLCLFLALTH